MKWAFDEFTGKRFGKYEVLCRLAIGGMAEIFLGFARTGPFANQPVVLKNILPEQRDDPQALQMLLDEARLTATLTHANIAQVTDLERAGEDVLMVIEFIQGANVEELVEAWSKQGEAVPLGFALACVREAAQGLAHAHLHKDGKGQAEPIIHRDVTPRNIMTGFDGATKMLDFGIARAMGSQRRTVAGMVRGTTAYMSPEQAVGKELDPRSDLFSLGIIFHELLTGQRLFAKGNPGAEMAAVYEGEIPLPSKVNRRVPRALDAVVMRALDRNRDKRYQTATELIRDLSLAAGSTIWTKERCAEMVKERFIERRRDLDRLLVRIPTVSAPGSGGTDEHPELPEYPESRTVMVQRPAGPPARVGIELDPLNRTAIDNSPAIAELRNRLRVPGDQRSTDATGENPEVTQNRMPPMPVDRPPRPSTPPPQYARQSTPPVSMPKPSTPQPQPARQGTPQPQPARPTTTPATPQPARQGTPPPQERLSADALFGDLTDTEARARVRPGSRSMRSLPEVKAEVPTASRAPIVIAVVLALVLGAGGMFVVSNLTKPSPQGLGRLSLKSDRPVAVMLNGQAMGNTPIDSLIPAGTHALQLTEADGTVRTLDLEVDVGAVIEKTVALDSLTKKQ